MMAAYRAASSEKKVLLCEKNLRLGEKLMLSGRGRCNFTNGLEGINDFVRKYGDKGKFLYSAFSKFSPQDTMSFFERNGVKYVSERGKRIFPEIGGSQRVLDMFLRLLKQYNVEIYRLSQVHTLRISDSRINYIVTDQEELTAEKYIIATGGLSYPKTGSTGDGYKFAQQAGHTIVKTYPALVPLKTQEHWVKLANGCDLHSVRVHVFLNGEEVAAKFGEMEFTNFGISGPIIMDLSSQVPDWRKLDENGESKDVLEFVLDLKPALTLEVLIARIRREMQQDPDEKYRTGTKRFSSMLRSFVPARLVRLIIELTDIPHDKPVRFLSKDEIEKLANVLKNIKLTINGLWGYDNAIVTRGGVSLKEIDPSTMRSKLCDNLYFAGEILDLNGPSGGFNLQMCWSTGYVAGSD